MRGSRLGVVALQTSRRSRIVRTRWLWLWCLGHQHRCHLHSSSGRQALLAPQAPSSLRQALLAPLPGPPQTQTQKTLLSGLRLSEDAAGRFCRRRKMLAPRPFQSSVPSKTLYGRFESAPSLQPVRKPRGFDASENIVLSLREHILTSPSKASCLRCLRKHCIGASKAFRGT